MRQNREPGVLICKRQYRRLIERLEGRKPSGWSELCLAGVGAGAALAAAALVAGLSLTAALPSAFRDILWVLTGVGGVILALCLPDV